ncbi:MAG: hypothetical protein QF415_13045 [Candidatus Undinarchaeales archaeon]|jgi:hypothetical protein|nr:hypothetical protein [Candidatus Undinarchaeales archaeon]MDP7493976.1 hypothetical protein [Candidatus Undinarchaeales archaeon]
MMKHVIACILMLCLMAGCSSGPADDGTPPEGSATATPTVEAGTGETAPTATPDLIAAESVDDIELPPDSDVVDAASDLGMDSLDMENPFPAEVDIS